MTSKGSNDDCYFYYYSSCTKGDDCPFRHCEAALGTETVCNLWREGACFRDNCKFRHMESRINRGFIRCYWEDQPSGCLKPHCVFFHRKTRHNIATSSGNEGLILPVSTSGSQSSPKALEVKDTVKNIMFNPVESYSNSNDEAVHSPSSHPVEPIVVSFDGEESDSESASSTPMKSVVYDSTCNSNSVKRDLVNSFLEKSLGIKTLEQIRMEKIHKESDNIYKSAYETTFADPIQPKMKTECYPPQSDFIKISDRPIEKSGSAKTEQYSSDNEIGIKSRLSKRVLHPSYSETSSPPKKMVCLKKSKEDPLDFKIKTLDEIRKERQNKSINDDCNNEKSPVQPQGTAINRELNNSTNKSPSLGNMKTESTNLNGKCFRKIRINRQQHKEAFSNSNAAQEADSSTENQKKDNQTQVLHEVQNIAEDQKKADIKGKRKESEDATHSGCTGPKQFKSESTSPNSINTSLTHSNLEKNSVQEIPVKKPTRPVIKRIRSTVIPESLVSTSEAEISSTVTKTCESPNSPPTENNKIPKADISLSSVSNTEPIKTVKATVDELDSFLMNETDVNLDYEPDGTINESDDLLLEIEQLLDS